MGLQATAPKDSSDSQHPALSIKDVFVDLFSCLPGIGRFVYPKEPTDPLTQIARLRATEGADSPGIKEILEAHAGDEAFLERARIIIAIGTTANPLP